MHLGQLDCLDHIHRRSEICPRKWLLVLCLEKHLNVRWSPQIPWSLFVFLSAGEVNKEAVSTVWQTKASVRGDGCIKGFTVTFYRSFKCFRLVFIPLHSDWFSMKTEKLPEVCWHWALQHHKSVCCASYFSVKHDQPLTGKVRGIVHFLFM